MGKNLEIEQTYHYSVYEKPLDWSTVLQNFSKNKEYQKEEDNLLIFLIKLCSHKMFNYD